jgi:putative transcriptional regulator
LLIFTQKESSPFFRNGDTSMNRHQSEQKTILFRDKGEFTKFQILFEIMRNQPHVKQKEISKKIGLTTQAISKYFKRLTKDDLIEIGSARADYRLTAKGLALLRENMSDLENYVRTIKGELKVEHSWTALATASVKAGEQVGLTVRGGLFYTVSTNHYDVKAVGTAISDANSGEDVGLKNLSGKVKIKQGKVLIVKLPSIRKGGSRAADLTKLRGYCDEFKPEHIGVMGAVARSVANKLGLKTDFEFGISHSATIAASRGLNVLVLVVGRMANEVIEEIDNQNLRFGSNIIYEVKDAQLFA